VEAYWLYVGTHAVAVTCNDGVIVTTFNVL
jgi:hypothetical protein